MKKKIFKFVRFLNPKFPGRFSFITSFVYFLIFCFYFFRHPITCSEPAFILGVLGSASVFYFFDGIDDFFGKKSNKKSNT